MIDGLPARPISPAELERIESSPSIEVAHPIVEHGNSSGAHILEFTVGLESGLYAGLTFDPTAREWHVAIRSEDYREVIETLSIAVD